MQVNFAAHVAVWVYPQRMLRMAFLVPAFLEPKRGQLRSSGLSKKKDAEAPLF